MQLLTKERAALLERTPLSAKDREEQDIEEDALVNQQRQAQIDQRIQAKAQELYDQEDTEKLALLNETEMDALYKQILLNAQELVYEEIEQEQ